jgi:hypothetical protein
VNVWVTGFVIMFALLMIVFWVINRRMKGRNLRDIPSFSNLQRAIDLAVEDGKRLHISIGHGDITGPKSAAALVGLSMLKRIITIASESDKPPVATAGDGALALLAQDTLRGTYHSMGTLSHFDPNMGRATGITPFSYAAGTLPVIYDEDVSANVLAGTFGSEVALITAAGEQNQSLTMAGADSVPAQAILYATAHEPLIGEELYAGGAYIDAGPMHTASLHAQDIMRWLLVLIMIGGAFGKLLGIIP